MSALRANPGTPPQKERQVGRLGKMTSALWMLAATAVMLTLLYPPFYCFFLAPFALVPFCVCVLRRPMNKGYLGLYYALGVAFFLPNLFWLGPVTIGGFIALSLFVALYIPLFAFGLHRLVVHLRLPATLAVPLVWTAVEFVRATFVMGGFPWFLLGNCLAPAPLLIQSADLFGVWGLTFLIAMLNGFVVDLLRLPLRQVTAPRQSRFSPAIRSLTAVVTVIVAVVIGYGVFRLDQNTTTPGPRVAVIQENIPQDLKDAAGTRDQVFLKHLALTDQALAANPRPDLVAWPETMVTAWINDEWRSGRADDFQTTDQLRAALSDAEKLIDNGSAIGEFRRSDDMYKALKDRADATGVPLLVGYGAYIPKIDEAPMLIQNRTRLISPGGDTTEEYSKVHLVPFGEFIPFHDVPLIGKLMLGLTPVDFDYSNTPGTVWKRFELPHKGSGSQPDPHPFIFATPICFEDTMPEPARMMSAPQFAGGRKADFLVNVSNDGWFFSVELNQHLQACQLRAVENRIAIARSVNTGNSGFIDSNGRIIKLVTGPDGKSIGAVGTAAMEIPIDSRVTPFSKIGDLFPITCGIVSTILVGWTLVRPRRGVPQSKAV